MDAKDFVEVIYDQGPVKVVRVGYWRRIHNGDESLWIWDGPPQSGPMDLQIRQRDSQ